LRSIIESLRGLVETKLTPEITYEVVNYHPGDFRGAGSSRGEFSVAVSNGFAIKDDLKKLGFMFDPPSKDWVLKHVRVGMDAPFGGSPKFERFLERQPSEKAVQAAIKVVAQLVKDANEQIVAANQAQLSKAGIGGNMPMSTEREVADWSDRQERSIKKLAKQGVVITREYDTGVGGFRKGGGVGVVRVKGNTFPLKDLFKKAGFRWESAGKSWTISTRSFTDDTLAKMVQVWGKLDDEEDDRESYKTGLSRSEPPGYDPNWEGEETPPWLA
jgi:hypothetical protein